MEMVTDLPSTFNDKSCMKMVRALSDKMCIQYHTDVMRVTRHQCVNLHPLTFLPLAITFLLSLFLCVSLFYSKHSEQNYQIALT